MKKLSLRLAAFFVIIYATLFGLDKYYTNYLCNHKNLCEKSDWTLNHNNKNFDFAFIGNSRVINMVDIGLIELQTGKKGINMGLTGANYAENYLLLDQFLKQGNKIKNLFIQIDMHSLKSSRLPYPFHNFNYMHLFSDTTVCRVYRDNNPAYKSYIWKYIPFTRYMEFSSKFVLYKMLKGGFECTSSAVFDPTSGTEFLEPRGPLVEDNVNAYWDVSPLDKKYLLQLVAIAAKNKMNTFFYTAPLYQSYYKHQLRLDNVLVEARQIAVQNNIPYYDLSKNDELCSNTAYFNDNIHMNRNGVEKFSMILCDTIKKRLN